MQTSSDRIVHNRSSSLDDTNGINVPFSGYTGPNADSILAKNVVEQTVGGSPLVLQDAHLKAALTSLQDIVDRLKLDTSGPNIPELSQSIDGPVPDWQEVDSILHGQDCTSFRRAVIFVEADILIDNASIIFMLCSPAMDFDNFANRCRELYEQQHTPSSTSRLLVYSGLYCLCSAYSALYEGDKAMHFEKLARMYQQRTLQVLAEVPMVVPATVENVEALLSGVRMPWSLLLLSCADMYQAAFAIDLCKPSLSRTLTCAAARLCQTLGYYRLATMANDTSIVRNRKILQFWLVYMMDRNISLRLGHAPTIQDYEISLPKPEPSDSCPAPLAKLVSYWIDVSRIQGQVCEHLYSPAACAQPNDIRIRRAEALAEELEKVYESRMQVDSEIVALFSMNGTTSIMAQQLISGGDTIMHHSTLTLILHAIPSTRAGVSPAVEAARAALRASPNLSECNTKNNYFWTQYCHW